MDLTEAREADIKSYGGAEKLALKFSYLRELLELERVRTTFECGVELNRSY